jgi:hypothetical protein
MLLGGLSARNLERLEALGCRQLQALVASFVTSTCHPVFDGKGYWALWYRSIHMAWEFFDGEPLRRAQQEAGQQPGEGQAAAAAGRLPSSLAMWRGPQRAKEWLQARFMQGGVSRRGGRRSRDGPNAAMCPLLRAAGACPGSATKQPTSLALPA